MLFDIHLIKNLCDLSILVDQKRLPVGAHVLLSVHALLDPDPVFIDDLLVVVSDKIELQSVLRSEFLMRLYVIDRDAKELDIVLIEFVVRITERACFLGSARGVVFRIKEQDDTLSLEVGELYRIAVLVFRFEVRRFVTCFEHKPPWG